MQDVAWHFYPHVAEHPVIRAFIESQVRRQKRPKTIDAYARNLEDLIQAFASSNVADLVEAGQAEIDLYLQWLSQRLPAKPRNRVTSHPGEGLSPNTIQQRLVTVRLFYDFCLFRGFRHDPTNPVPRGHVGGNGTSPKRGMVSHPTRLPWIPSDQEWECLLTHLMLHESTRNQALICLAYDGALRREEAVSLRAGDLDWSARSVTIRAATSKSRQQRTVCFSPATGALLQRYLWNERTQILEAFGGDTAGPLFLSESNRNAGQPITLGTFNDVIERVRASVNLPWLTTHTFRHLRCTVLKRCGVDLQDIALYAGHKSVATTQIYVHLAPAELHKRLRDATASFDARMQHLIEARMNDGATYTPSKPELDDANCSRAL